MLPPSRLLPYTGEKLHFFCVDIGPTPVPPIQAVQELATQSDTGDCFTTHYHSFARVVMAFTAKFPCVAGLFYSNYHFTTFTTIIYMIIEL
jgi:hypothetical protein